jgi:hypothetical protein
MSRKTWTSIVAIATAAVATVSLIGGGCDKPEARKTILLNPTTRQVHSAGDATQATAIELPKADPATRAATTQFATKSVIYVDRVPYTFPPAKLVWHKEKGAEKIRTLLCSNDPPEVVSPNYQGNRYSFEMMADAADSVADLSKAEYSYRAPSQEPQDTPNGIFLDGDRTHLQPYEILVTFERREDKQIVAEIQGTFIRVSKGNRLGDMVRVTAILVANPTNPDQK